MGFKRDTGICLKLRQRHRAVSMTRQGRDPRREWQDSSRFPPGAAAPGPAGPAGRRFACYGPAKPLVNYIAKIVVAVLLCQGRPNDARFRIFFPENHEKCTGGQRLQQRYASARWIGIARHTRGSGRIDSAMRKRRARDADDDHNWLVTCRTAPAGPNGGDFWRDRLRRFFGRAAETSSISIAEIKNTVAPCLTTGNERWDVESWAKKG